MVEGSQRALGIALLVLTGALGASGPLRCRGDTAALYALDEGSHVVEGCFDPCLCPLRLAEDLRGVFLLEPSSALPAGLEPAVPAGLVSVRSYDVPWLLWTYGSGDARTTVTGRGTYQVGGEFARVQRLVLDLRVGDEAVQRYDSGWVVGGDDTTSLPPIAIEVSHNGRYCYDRVFSIRAVPRVTY